MSRLDCNCMPLPGIADGPPDLEAAVALCRALSEQGITEAVACPPWDNPRWPLSDATVVGAFRALRTRLAEAHVHLNLLLGAEQRIGPDAIPGPTLDLLRPLGAGALVLLACDDATPQQLAPIFGAIAGRGHRIVLAHPERAACCADGSSLWNRIADMGILLQIDVGSLLGDHGAAVKAWAEQLVECYPERTVLGSRARVAQGPNAPAWGRLPAPRLAQVPASLSAMQRLLGDEDLVELPKDPDTATTCWRGAAPGSSLIRRRRSVGGESATRVGVGGETTAIRLALAAESATPGDDHIPVAAEVSTPTASPALPVARPTGRLARQDGLPPLTATPAMTQGPPGTATHRGSGSVARLPLLDAAAPDASDNDTLPGWMDRSGWFDPLPDRGGGAPPPPSEAVATMLPPLDLGLGVAATAPAETGSPVTTTAGGDERERARQLRELATTAAKAGRPDEAIARHREALALHRRLGDRAGEARCLYQLAALQARSDDTEDAEELCRHGLLLVENGSDRRLELAFLEALARIQHKRKDRDGAGASLKRAVGVAEALGDRGELLQLREQLARVIGRNDPSGAAKVLRQNIDEASSTEHAARRCSAAWRLAQVLDTERSRPEAVLRLTAAVDGYKDLFAKGQGCEVPEPLAQMELRLAELLLGAGVPREALFRFRYALDEQRRADAESPAGMKKMAKCLIGLANCFHLLGDSVGSRETLAQAKRHAEKLGDAALLEAIAKAEPG